uniref:Caffeoyl-CoA O-methyltransferase n=1 Tax=Magnetococcus massalia (strain MO-1) TaxID=451514 RepID=A0A1S7LER1_MAGMO|nr:Caffeoyl-CoA O-methyltransferase [Candidatus Magnetococcus massalia]
MANRTLNLTDALYQYLLDHGVRESDVMRDLRAETSKQPWARMQIGPDQGQFMGLLVKLMGATRIIEIGTFTGYSALCLAQAMPAEGRLICLDYSAEWTAVAPPFWQRAGVADKIDLRIAPAQESLPLILQEFGPGCFDMVFIDADKTGYPNYFEICLKLIRQGGLMMFDNTLWGGEVINPENRARDTNALRQINRLLHQDERVDISMLAIGDGLTLVRKR